MNVKCDTKVEDEEETSFFGKEPLSEVKKVDCDVNGSNSLIDEARLKEQTEIPNRENIEFAVWKNRKICVNKCLIPLRLAQLFWFASGSICLPFFSLMILNRGLKLSEFSFVFSMLFLFQLAVAYFCGITADKLGNAKTVLLFLMLSTTSIVMGFLLAPSVTEKSCLQHILNKTCLSIFNHTLNLERCENVCSLYNTSSFMNEIKNKKNNDSKTFFKRFDNRSNNEITKDEDYINATFATNIYCDEICSCLGYSAEKCTFMPKSGFKILYLVLILSFFSLWSTSYRFLDFASINAAKQYNSNFGKERSFGIVGKLIAAVLCNFVLNIGKSESRQQYDNVFWFVVVLEILAVISVYNMRLFKLPPGLNLTKNTLKLFTDIEIVLSVLVAFVVGTAFSFNSFFQVWFLDSLKASKQNIGIHILMDPLYELPMYLSSTWWLRKFRRKTIVIICLLGYTVSGISYSFLYNPWLSLIIKITKPFSFDLFWITLVVHCREIAPEGFAATVNAVVGTVHFGVGRSFGVSVGGHLMSTYGARTTFRILAGFCGVTAVLYSTFLYLKQLFTKRDREYRSEEPQEMEAMRGNEV